MVDHNVCQEVSPPRVPAPEIRPLNAEEAKRFLEAAQSDRFDALYVLGLTTGARMGELGGMFWSDLGRVDKVVRIQRAHYGSRGANFRLAQDPQQPQKHRSIGAGHRGA
jgi:integrase